MSENPIIRDFEELEETEQYAQMLPRYLALQAFRDGDFTSVPEAQNEGQLDIAEWYITEIMEGRGHRFNNLVDEAFEFIGNACNEFLERERYCETCCGLVLPDEAGYCVWDGTPLLPGVEAIEKEDYRAWNE